MSDENQPLAFKDFKNAVTVKEFETVIEIVQERYNKLKDAVDTREKFVNGKDERVKELKDMAVQRGLEERVVHKIIMGLEKKTDKLFYKTFKEDVEQHVPITDFLNRFRETNNQLEYFDFSFLKEFANPKNSTNEEN